MKKDNLILIGSLSFFFFSGCLALLNLQFGGRSDPESLIISPTVQALSEMDPRPKMERLTKLCFSEEKYAEFLGKERERSGQGPVASGTLDDGRRFEIHAAAAAQGTAGEFSVYAWEAGTGHDLPVCRILVGQDFRLGPDVKAE